MDKTQELIDAVNRANLVLADTLLKLQNAFGVKPDMPDFLKDILGGTDIFGDTFKK